MSINFGEPEPPPGGSPFGAPAGPGMPPAPAGNPFPPPGVGPQPGYGSAPGPFGAAPGGLAAPPGPAGFPAGQGDQWGDSFGGQGYSDGQFEAVSSTPGKPPIGWLVAAVVIALVGGGVALWLRALPVILACWFVAGPVAVGLFAQFRTRDQAARAKTTYLGGGWVTGLAITAGVVILVAVGMTAFAVGRWVAYA